MNAISFLRIFAAGVVLLLSASGLLANSTGAVQGASGAPGETTCTDCHGGTANSGSGRVQIIVANGATSYTPGQTYRLRVVLQDPGARRWGFSLTPRASNQGSRGLGTLSNAGNAHMRVAPDTSAGTQYITHTVTGTRTNQADQAEWEFDWTAPATADGSVTFYVAGNATNNNGASDPGDRVYTSNLTLTPPGTAGTIQTKALAQVAFGGGWYTALYFTNTGGSAASFNVAFFDDNGNPLPVPAPSGTNTTFNVNIPPGGTGLIEAPNQGSLVQGWARAELPEGVVGYGVFRQTTPGNPDQEAVVPLASTQSQRSFITFDNTSGLVAALSVLNPTDNSVTVTFTARQENGAAIGTPSTLILAPRNKRAFALSSQTGLTDTANRRGSVEVTTSSGAVAVLGLRFKGTAFTSTPAAEK